MVGVLELISEQLALGEINVVQIIYNFVLALILLGVGIFLGKVVKFILKKGVDKSNLGRTVKPSFINLFLTIIKWSIYILFLSLALNMLNVPNLTNWLSSALVIVPALVGSLILIVVGFAIATYLRDLVEESGILGWKTLSMIFFYFVIYIFMIYALKAALIGQEAYVTNNIIIIVTAIVSAAVAYWHVKKK